MTDVVVPKLNNNDVSYVLIEWLVPDGQAVRPGEALAVIETSKAQEEMEARAGGIVHALAQAGDECRPGQVIGHVHASAADTSGCPGPARDESDLLITRDAQAIIDRHGITDRQLRDLGRKVIRKADLAPLLETRAGRTGLAPRQRAVADVVTRSAQTIPAGSVYIKVGLGAAPDPVAEPALLVHTLARLWSRHPAFFSGLTGDGVVNTATCANIGITLDAGAGLFVPVIHGAQDLAFSEIAESLAGFRVKALRGEFRPDELAGGNIMVALHNDAGVTIATPLIFPGHACAVSLGDRQHELALDGDGRLVRAAYVNIGLVYDHRLLNGREAMAFLRDLRQCLTCAETSGQEGGAVHDSGTL